MFNVMLDTLPYEWNGFPIDADFRTGIMINQCLNDDELNEKEQLFTALELLFPEERPSFKEAKECLKWFLTEYIHDNNTKKKKSSVVVMDFDIDQWRIYAAFWNQYRLDLNTVELHWFQFMGLLTNLKECSFLHVMEAREKTITSKMSAEERKYWKEKKEIFAIKPHKVNTSPADQKAVNEFMKYANINKKDN